ncbi:MAG: hypothetical protein LBU34_03135 [Planctomycetaceae bacterium]|nr:hypothetical protein [Planctomycetaceae bacterium]
MISLPFILRNVNKGNLFSQVGNRSPKVHKVGNRSPKGFHPTIASALADWEFVQCWLF